MLLKLKAQSLAHILPQHHHHLHVYHVELNTLHKSQLQHNTHNSSVLFLQYNLTVLPFSPQKWPAYYFLIHIHYLSHMYKPHHYKHLPFHLLKTLYLHKPIHYIFTQTTSYFSITSHATTTNYTHTNSKPFITIRTPPNEYHEPLHPQTQHVLLQHQTQRVLRKFTKSRCTKMAWTKKKKLIICIPWDS